MGPLERVCVMLTKLRDNNCKERQNFVAIAAPLCVAILLCSAFVCICFLFTHTSISVSVYRTSSALRAFHRRWYSAFLLVAGGMSTVFYFLLLERKNFSLNARGIFLLHAPGFNFYKKNARTYCIQYVTF